MNRYKIVQKSGTMFTINDAREPKEMYAHEQNLGSGLRELYLLEKMRWAEVQPDGTLGEWKPYL